MNTTNTKKSLTPAEQAELKKMEEEEAATKEAMAAVAMQKQAASAAAVVPVPQSPKPVEKKIIGDIPVTCLKTESFCIMGGRKYNLQKGVELMMDPSHAAELSSMEQPWVAPVSVIHSR